MNAQVSLTVKGKPRPLSRTGHGQFGGKFLSAPSSRQIGLVVDAWERAGSPELPANAPLELTARFYFERPQGHFGTGRNEGALKTRFLDAEPIGRPDLDNLVKLICEAFQGNMFKDDSRVVRFIAGKFYGRPARTEIRVCELAESKAEMAA